MLNPIYEPASFRDLDGSVLYHQNRVLRTLTADAADRMKKLLGKAFFQKLMSEKKVIHTTYLENKPVGIELVVGYPYFLEHEKIPIITFPYEWTFHMLKDAALTQLDILMQCIENGFILKDGSAFNMAMSGHNMCFIDVLSIDDYKEGQPWEGFSQFCENFLYPLMLTAYKGIDFQSYWRGSLQGVKLSDMANVMGVFDAIRPGVLKYVFLQEKLSSSSALNTKTLLNKFKENIFPKKMLTKLVEDLKSVVVKLKAPYIQSDWIHYINNNSYDVTGRDIKHKTIKNFVESYKSTNMVDFGANTGEYSLICAKYANVVSIDLDPCCMDNLYLHMKRENISKVLPVVNDMMNPSPALGWDCKERKTLYSRLQGCDGFLALALIHHLCIGCNLPIESFLDCLRNTASRGIIEWVDKSDPMVQFMLRNRKDVFINYNWVNFKNQLENLFEIQDIVELNQGTRKLCVVSNRT